MKSKKREMWEIKKIIDEVLSFFKKILPHIIAGFLVLTIFFVVVDAYEFLTTEYWWLQNNIKHSHTGLFFLFLIMTASLLNWKKLLDSNKWLSLFFTIIFLVALYGHTKYINYYKKLQKLPKIKELSRDWGLPGSLVKIKGKNFGHTYEPGRILLNNEKTIIKSWSNDEIIFEVPAIKLNNVFEIRIEKEKIYNTGLFYELKEL